MSIASENISKSTSKSLTSTFAQKLIIMMTFCSIYMQTDIMFLVIMALKQTP